MKLYTGLVQIVSTLSIPLFLSTCTQKTSNEKSEYTQELDKAGEMYSSLGLNRSQTHTLFTAERDSTGKPIPIDINFVGQCLELYKQYKIGTRHKRYCSFPRTRMGLAKN